MSPVDGDAILKLLARTAATPKDVIARYNAIGGEQEIGDGRRFRNLGATGAHAFSRDPVLLPEVIARQHVEVGAGDADHPGLLRMRRRMDHARAIGLGLTGPRRYLLTGSSTAWSSLSGLARRHSVISVCSRALP